ncbi:unnamed protein product [Moneuplotes crassus]|uniref:B box-type domain-containing protein n=1 Tax=Euplotes crassus TaxID=5936 RepID=A0AAD1UAQ2_EUPCR|nr:unnamed protein product [Moneuplotes crassus]
MEPRAQQTESTLVIDFPSENTGELAGEEAKQVPPSRPSAIRNRMVEENGKQQEENKQVNRLSPNRNLSPQGFSTTSDEFDLSERSPYQINARRTIIEEPSSRNFGYHRMSPGRERSPRRSPMRTIPSRGMRGSRNMRVVRDPFHRHIEERKIPLTSENRRNSSNTYEVYHLNDFVSRHEFMDFVVSRNRPNLVSQQEIDAQTRRIESIEKDSELAIFNCNICFGRQCLEYQICRFCSGQACTTCWDGIMNGNKKCPFCRTFLIQNDLIKNRFVEDVREMLENPDRKYESSGHKCPIHHKKGSQYCETCAYFICIDCIKEGTHSGHDLCEIDDKPELKEKIEQIDKFHGEIKNISKLFKKIDKEYSDHYNLTVEDMDWIAKRLKTKINNTIDTVFSKQKQKFEEAQSKFSEFKKDKEKFDQTEAAIFAIGHKKFEMDELKDKFKNALISAEAGEMVNIVSNQNFSAQKDDVISKYEMAAIPSSASTYKQKYLKALLSEINKIKEI